MEYSLNNLSKKAFFPFLRINEIVDKLNLIGFEIDDVIIQTSTFNSSCEKIRLTIKIPSNREDLLSEKYFLIELSTIFFFTLLNNWNELKKNYSFLLKQKYFQYSKYNEIKIDSELSSLLIYNIQVKNFSPSFFSFSPLWIQSKLLDLGFSTKNNFEDIITLVKSEWGQTFNFFSINLEQHELLSFFLKQIECEDNFLDSTGNTYELRSGSIVLKDQKNNILTVLGIPNIITKEKEEKISQIFIQGIFYNIYENKLLLNSLNNKISLRSFRKLFLENFKFSFQRILTLLEIVYSLSIVPTVYSLNNSSINLKKNKILKIKKNSFLFFLNIIEIELPIFEKIGLKIICKTKEDLYFSIPDYRNDLIREIDLLEEYSRFVGYKNFCEIIPKKEKTLFKKTNENIIFIKQFFLNSGFNEVITNSLEDKKKEKINSILINNPLNNEFSNLRTNLLSNLINIFENNIRLNFQAKNFFEIGRIFTIEKNNIIESEKIAGIFQLEILKKAKTPTLEWFFAKGLIEQFILSFGYESIEFEPLSFSSSLFNTKKSIILKSKNVVLGIFGELNQLFEKKNNLKYSTYLFELNLDSFNFCKVVSKIKIVKEISKYPTITKDCSFLINKEKDLSLLKMELGSICNYLKTFHFFDIYFDEKNSKNVNIGIRFKFQSKNETLTNEMIEKEMQKIYFFLIQNFEIELRE
jgi:phenylalanyl-tRNA synthetase beta chain